MKVQQALDRLYSLKDSVKNNYPFVKYKKEEKFDDTKGVQKLIEKDRNVIQNLIDNRFTKEELKAIFNMLDVLSALYLLVERDRNMLDKIKNKIKQQLELCEEE